MSVRVNTFTAMMALLFNVCAVRPVFAQQKSLTDKARQSIVHISFEMQGTGFIVSSSGPVLTVSHLFCDWKKQFEVDKNRNNLIIWFLRDKPGNVPVLDSFQAFITQNSYLVDGQKSRGLCSEKPDGQIEIIQIPQEQPARQRRQPTRKQRSSIQDGGKFSLSQTATVDDGNKHFVGSGLR
jgi:hypothetical protein